MKDLQKDSKSIIEQLVPKKSVSKFKMAPTVMVVKKWGRQSVITPNNRRTDLINRSIDIADFPIKKEIVSPLAVMPVRKKKSAYIIIDCSDSTE